MRTISSAMTTAQQSTSATPYIKLKFTDPDGYTVDYSDRILALEHTEEPYRDNATITLVNDDREVVDLIGYWTEIGYGYYTGNNVSEPHGDGAGNEYSYTSRLWVKQQGMVSSEGVLKVLLELEGVWTVLEEQLLRIGDPPFYTDQDEELDGMTVYGILEYILETEMTAATGYTFVMRPLPIPDDDIIDDYIPVFSVNQAPFEDTRYIIGILLNMTKCYIRPKAGLEFEIVYPQESDSAHETYYSDQAHFFKEYTERKQVMVPNHIIVYANEGSNNWVNYITGEAEDTDEEDKYMEVIALHLAPTITTQADADNRAAAILAKAEVAKLAARLVAPHDCSIEVYDKVAIYDNRGL